MLLETYTETSIFMLVPHHLLPKHQHAPNDHRSYSNASDHKHHPNHHTGYTTTINLSRLDPSKTTQIRSLQATCVIKQNRISICCKV